MGQGKEKMLWSFPAVLKLLFFVYFSVCSFVNLWLFNRVLKILILFLIVFLMFLWSDSLFDLLTHWSDLTPEKEMRFEYVEFAMHIGRPSVHVPQIDLRAWIFLMEDIWAINRDWDVITLLWNIQRWIRSSGSFPGNVTIEENIMEAENLWSQSTRKTRRLWENESYEGRVENRGDWFPLWRWNFPSKMKL